MFFDLAEEVEGKVFDLLKAVTKLHGTLSMLTGSQPESLNDNSDKIGVSMSDSALVYRSNQVIFEKETRELIVAAFDGGVLMIHG